MPAGAERPAVQRAGAGGAGRGMRRVRRLSTRRTGPVLGGGAVRRACRSASGRCLRRADSCRPARAVFVAGDLEYQWPRAEAGGGGQADADQARPGRWSTPSAVASADPGCPDCPDSRSSRRNLVTRVWPPQPSPPQPSPPQPHRPHSQPQPQRSHGAAAHRDSTAASGRSSMSFWRRSGKFAVVGWWRAAPRELTRGGRPVCGGFAWG